MKGKALIRPVLNLRAVNLCIVMDGWSSHLLRDCCRNNEGREEVAGSQDSAGGVELEVHLCCEPVPRAAATGHVSALCTRLFYSLPLSFDLFAHSGGPNKPSFSCFAQFHSLWLRHSHWNSKEDGENIVFF